eukprot:CAMPEP_0206213586 /NCGR_PEP_ID=MMETSP0047_2-20121206/1203_1 /ASSEMBLY_ACC=CAM_ASM_000192 /TAXON_ID=195065 /ORGANISM="Chroomonas mesostigmatica_cf, Strain CCMP1168" /LENGTH=513 /DNA_ID=CAMNT_0053635749 /DNA_START=1 /DNA_END=1542 /DNA_ORIENTATION=-
MGAVVDNVDICLVMEYMHFHSLHEVLHNKTMRVDCNMCVQMLQQVISGMLFIHSADPPIIHTDLKASNVLVDRNFTAKISDFGLSRIKTEESFAAGSPFWTAPEVLRGGHCTTMSDVYSFGVLLCEVFSLEEPYEGEDPALVLEQLQDSTLDPPKRPRVPEHIPKILKHIMEDSWHGDPKQRVSFAKLGEIMATVELDTVLASGSLGWKNPTALDYKNVFASAFPEPVLKALLAGKKIPPQSYDMVTVFFSDIAGFTSMCEKMCAVKVTNMLDRLYKKFDALALKHSVWQLETIGDAYIAVTNLVKDQSKDHCARIARFSLDAIDAANSTYIDEEDLDKGVVQIRIGFSSGPVVANIVGQTHPKYTLFGSSVNTASRMESSSLPGKAHCSEMSAQLLLLQDLSITLCPRGAREVKGRGKMRTYFIERTASRVRSEDSPPGPHPLHPPLWRLEGSSAGSSDSRTAPRRLSGNDVPLTSHTLSVESSRTNASSFDQRALRRRGGRGSVPATFDQG